MDHMMMNDIQRSPPPPLWITCQDQSVKIPRETAMRVEQIAMMLISPMKVGQDLVTSQQEGQKRYVKRVGCEEFSAALFKATVLLLAEDRPWSEAFSQEQQSSPNFFSDLHHCIGYLYPSRVEELTLQTIPLLSHMPLTTAYHILDNCDGDLLEAPRLAYKRVKQSIYFPDDATAELHFKQESRRRQSISKNLTMMHHYNASRHIMDEDVIIRAKAERSAKIVKNYRTEILELLKESKANIEREDLLDYLIGPKAFFFDYYSIFPKKNFIADRHNSNRPFNPNYPFIYIRVNSINIGYSGRKKLLGAPHTSTYLGYRLENLGPYELEEEIRYDLRHHPERIPPRLIQQNTITQQISPELQRLQKKIRPAILQWTLLEREQRNDILAEIIQYNGWEAYNIQPSDLELTIPELPPDTEMNCYTVIGSLLINSGKQNIKFNTFNFRLLILEEIQTYPDSLRTHTILKSIYKRMMEYHPTHQ